MGIYLMMAFLPLGNGLMPLYLRQLRMVCLSNIVELLKSLPLSVDVLAHKR